MATSKPLIFISHVHEDARLAVRLEETLSQLLLGGVRFFVSSDGTSIRPGDDWMAQIKSGLTDACIVLVMVSPESLHRPWINFEAGAAWLQKTVIPICYGGISPSQLPPPLNHLQALDLELASEFKKLCMSIASAASLHTPAADWHSISESFRSLRDSGRSAPPGFTGAPRAWVFPSSQHHLTMAAIEGSLRRCKVASLYGIGLNFLWNASNIALIEEQVHAGQLSARICMGNFKSDQLQDRMREEPKHPFGVPGSEYLIRRLLSIENSVANEDQFSIRLFEHPPTHALLLFDSEYYLYPYCFGRLGNESPTFFNGLDALSSQFFQDQYSRIWESARPASEVYDHLI